MHCSRIAVVFPSRILVPHMNARLFRVVLSWSIVLLAGEGAFSADNAPEKSAVVPVVLVEADYPGANAQIIADVLAAPIEQQIRGMERLLSMRSRCRSDGTYTLALTFERSADLKTMKKRVQARVELAKPQLPLGIADRGVVIKPAASGVRMVVNLRAPEDRFDTLYLSNYAQIQIQDELALLPGVTEVVLIGQQDATLRIWLDPERLAARKLTAAEVVEALKNQNLGITKDPTKGKKEDKKRGFEIELKTLGRLLEPETLEAIIVKTDSEGRVVRLRDVARIELSRKGQGPAWFDGKPAAALLIHAAPGASLRKLSAALREKVDELRRNLPDGLDLGISFDFRANIEAPNQRGTPEYLLLDIDLTMGASEQRTWETLRHCEKLLRRNSGVDKVQIFYANPFDLFAAGPCILVSLVPVEKRDIAREKIAREIRTRLGEIKEISVRLRDLTNQSRFPSCAYPIDLAVSGPKAGEVRKFAEKLGERLAPSKKLMDVWTDPNSSPRPQRIVEIDRARIAAHGLTLADINDAIRLSTGATVNDFSISGSPRKVQRITIQVMTDSEDWAKDLLQLKVRNNQGEMIALEKVIKVRESKDPPLLDFLDGQPMVETTANPVTGTSHAQARKICETGAEEVRKELGLAKAYRLTWLREIPAGK